MYSLELENYSITQISLSLGIGLIVFFIVYILLRIKTKWSSSPPGPFPLPLIGNLHNLGLEPFKSFMKMRKKYGDVFTVKFGSYPTIVLNGHQAIRKYLNMGSTAGRPHLLPLVRNPEEVKRGVIGNEGDQWIEQRRFVIRNLRDFGFGKKSMEILITYEVSELITKFRKTLGQPIDTQDKFIRAVISSLYSICIGKSCGDGESDKDFETILKSIGETMRGSTGSGLLAFFPKIAKMFPVLSGYQYMIDWSYPMLDAFREEYNQHKKTFSDNSKRDLIDCYISEIQNTKNPESSFFNKTGEQNMVMTLQDLFLAGSETTSTALTWTFLILALHPEIQTKLQNEIDSVINSSKPSLTHRNDMPYYQCMIMEILRFSSIVPMGVFHSITKPVQIEGYVIPKGTIVAANLYGLHHDPEVWGSDVEEIKPERFLCDDGKTVNRNHEAWMPFSTGKRVCLGETLARDTLFLFITSIFQIFRVTIDPNVPKPTLKYHVGITLSPLKHEVVLIEREL